MEGRFGLALALGVLDKQTGSARLYMKTGQMKLKHQKRNGFTLVELLVVMGIIMILASLLLPSLARAKASANRIKCVSNNKQLQIACQMYVDDNDDRFPPRRPHDDNWVMRLKPYYVNPKVLVCPSDSFTSDRSVIINAFNDYFQMTLTPEQWSLFRQWQWTEGMPANAIPDASQTIIFGERSGHHVHMDYHQGTGNDLEEINHNAHRGGSVFSMADGSARYIKKFGSVNPQNLWAVTPEWRNTPVATN